MLAAAFTSTVTFVPPATLPILLNVTVPLFIAAVPFDTVPMLNVPVPVAVKVTLAVPYATLFVAGVNVTFPAALLIVYSFSIVPE